MDFPWTVLAVTAAYLATSLVIGLWPRRSITPTAEGFVAGDRTLGLFVMYFITGATIFSAFAFLGGPGFAYTRGAAVFYILGYGALGMLPFYFLGPRAAELGRKRGYVTQAEMLAGIFDLPPLAAVMAIVSVVGFVPYLALQMQGAGYVLETMTQGRVPDWAGALIVYSVVLIYVLRSGVLGVGWTNTLQGIFMMVLAWGLGLYLPYKLYGGIPELFSRIVAERPELLRSPGLTATGTPWATSEYGSAVIVSVIGFSMWPHLFMKAFTARSEDTLRRTVVLYPTFQIFLVPLFIIGFCGVFFETAPAEADQILPHILMHSDIPAVIVGLFCAGALAASMSSGDAMAHAAASIAVRDGWVTALGRQLEPRIEQRAIRIAVVVVMAAAYAVAIGYEGSLVILLLTTYGSVVQFAPGMVLGLYSPRVEGRAVLGGLVVGSLVTLGLVVFPTARPWAIHAGLYGLTANVTTLGLIHFATTSARDR